MSNKIHIPDGYDKWTDEKRAKFLAKAVRNRDQQIAAEEKFAQPVPVRTASVTYLFGANKNAAHPTEKQATSGNYEPTRITKKPFHEKYPGAPAYLALSYVVLIYAASFFPHQNKGPQDAQANPTYQFAQKQNEGIAGIVNSATIPRPDLSRLDTHPKIIKYN